VVEESGAPAIHVFHGFCTNDGFWLAESDHEKLSAKKFMSFLFGAKDNLFHMSIEQSWTFRWPAEKPREANL
jgi:hypothetical protein